MKDCPPIARKMMNIQNLLTLWQNTPQISENIASWKTIPPRSPLLTPFPEGLHHQLIEALHKQGINTLYAHQNRSLELVRKGHNVVVVTGTASGKTLCYNLPVLDHLVHNADARALYLFPTKALAQDQLSAANQMLAGWQNSLTVSTYDGDTIKSHRPGIRENARLIISNPDMLHLGILPYHTRWAKFFQHLKFVILDEMHIYRGVFGSHIANVLRRLRRITTFYGARPQFILTSATIANPVELAEGLIESTVHLVDEDGSARGQQHFLIYNPPIINPELGIRRGVLQESVYLSGDLLAYDVQTIIFARSRRAVELTLTYLREQNASSQNPARQFLPEEENGNTIRAYRSGYLPHERREIEHGLRAGQVRAVAATNALELGVDIGGMGAVLLSGYPGTIAGTWQQAGRAGRGTETSLAVLLTSANPLNQYLARHPEYFFESSPESALIDPDNLLILLEHLRCAAFELPFQDGDAFGQVDPGTVSAILDVLISTGSLHRSRDKYFWISDQYPAQNVSLRNASANRVLLRSQGVEGSVTIGEVDGESAHWMVHPGAVYLHDAQTFLVDELLLEEGTAYMHPVDVDYYTEPRSETEVALIEKIAEASVNGGIKSHGEISVTTRVNGFRRILWETHERLSVEPLELPPTELRTKGYWLSIGEDTIEKLRVIGFWGNDPNQYGPNWSRQREAARSRDNFRCQVCGVLETDRAHHVHHKIPFRSFNSYEAANNISNLITLCPSCHSRAETVVRIRSGLTGLASVLSHLAPLFLMCDRSDLGNHADPQSPLANGQPTIVLYDRVPAGIGFSDRLFEMHDKLLETANELVRECPCMDGCPSCVGPGGEMGMGGKKEALALLKALV